MAGPGKDNITGDRYTLDLGVEPDLGNLLQNLTVANRLLDEAENKFKAISTVVGSTTQRVNELTRATQLFVTQTQRIRNEYQGIADASSRIGDLSGGIQSSGMGLIGAGMSPSVTNQLIAQSMVNGRRFSEPGEVEENLEVRLEPPREKKSGSVFSQVLKAEVFKDVFKKDGEKSEEKSGNSFGLNQDQLRTAAAATKMGMSPQMIENYYGSNMAQAAAKMTAASTIDPAAASASAIAANTGLGGEFLSTAETVGGGVIGSMLAKGQGSVLTSMLGKMGLGKLAPALSKALPMAGPLGYAYIAKQIVDVAYNAISNTALKAQEYTKLSGGTSVAQSGYTPFDGMRGEELRASAVRNDVVGDALAFFGYTNPLFNREQSREANNLAVGAGYRQGSDRRKNLFDYLKTTTIKGFADMSTNLDLYREVVDKAGGSTGGLVSAIDRLKEVAQTSDVSIQSLAVNFKKQVEELTSYGLGGSNAAAYAAVSTTAYAKAGTSGVRNGPGPDLGSPYMRAGLANYLGVNYSEVPGALSEATVTIDGREVGTTEAMADFSDQEIAETLQGMGFTPGMDRRAIMDKVSIFGPALQTMGILPANIDPNDATTVTNFIQQYTGGSSQEGKGFLTPMADAYDKQREESKATALGDRYNTEAKSSTWGGALGGIAGGIIGGVAGTFLAPGVGTAAGAALGAEMGMVLGGGTGFANSKSGYEALDKAEIQYEMDMDRGIDLTPYEGGNFEMYDYGDQTNANGKKRTAQAAYIEQWYEAQLNNEDLGGDWLDIGQGGMNMPIMNELMKMAPEDLRNVYVDINGRQVNLANAMHGDAELSSEEEELLNKGLSGEVDLGYSIKDEQGLLGPESQLSNLAIDNETREKEEEEKNMPDGSSAAKALWVRNAPTGVYTGGGRVE